MSGSFVKIKSEEAPWSTGIDYEAGNLAHRPPLKAAISRCRRPTRCRTFGPRSVCCSNNKASKSKCITTRWRRRAKTKSARSSARWSSARIDADLEVHGGTWPPAMARRRRSCRSRWSAITARACTHQSVWKDGTNLFAGNGYGGLSDFALYYIGGIIKHAKALNAITNPGTNSYKRLVPGLKRRLTLLIRRAIVRRHAAFRMFPIQRDAESKCAFPIRPQILIWHFQRC